MDHGAAARRNGEFLVYKVPVTDLIGQRLQVTLPLSIGAMLVATLVALSLGIFAATNHNRVGDYGVMGISQLGLAIPDFWFGILLIILFAVIFQWLPSGGFPGWDEGIWRGVRSLILPILTLSLSLTPVMTRITRSSVLDEAQEDYVRTARAKGLSQRAALWGHVLRNALVPVLTIGGLLPSGPNRVMVAPVLRTENLHRRYVLSRESLFLRLRLSTRSMV